MAVLLKRKREKVYGKQVSGCPMRGNFCRSGGGIDSLAEKAPVTSPGLTCEDITSEDACGHFAKKCSFNKDLGLCFTQENPAVPNKKEKGRRASGGGG